MSVTRTFLPWYRRGLVTALSGAPQPRGRAALPATVKLRGSSNAAAVPAELAGPGDVIGIDAGQILRTEPYDGCPDFEPGYFPFVEFADPDYPWRFSPFAPESIALSDPASSAAVTATGSVRPWLSLVVVSSSAAHLEPAAAGGLPLLATAAEELPPSAEAWAWAHVQVVTADGQTAEEAVQDATRRATRVLCPRRLRAGTSYIACLVPAFAAGASRFGLATAGGPLDPAWGSSGDVQLPIYFSWSFATGEAGTFETLASRLRPRPAPASAGGMPVATDAPGWGATASPGASVLMQGALRPIDAAESAGDPALAESLRGAISSDAPGVQLRPPIYGQDYQRGLTALSPNASGWLAQLNTDPRRRIAAGLAAWAVAVEQEQLADRAWQQLAEGGVAAEQGASPELASLVAQALVKRHGGSASVSAPAALARLVRPSDPGTALASARLAPAATLEPAPGAAPAGFAPTFDDAAYTLLRAVAAEWLLPGAGDIADESVVLLRSNPAFVEAFIVGLNDALSRELVWRRYPLRRGATMFGEFWSGAAGADAGLKPIDSWPADDALGTHEQAADQLVLLLRGSLLRRFPTASIYLARTLADGSEQQVPPVLGGSLGPGATFLGFPLSAEDARSGGGTTPTGAEEWLVVIEESVHHARFGIDDPPRSGVSASASWQNLDWSHSQFTGRTTAPVAGPLLGTTRPAGAGSTTLATWGASSGHMAVALQQPATRVRIPVRLWLDPEPGS